MRVKGPTRGPRVLRDQPPMDADQIVLAAVVLTREHGLDHWTLRQLADALGCWPTVVYHHVGDRAAVSAEVVNHVVGLVRPLDESVPWRQSFDVLLRDLRTVLRRHPGVARWLALSGPVVPSALRIIDRGVQILANAGLGDEAAAGYGVLINTALLAIAIEDDRDSQPGLREEVKEVLGHYSTSTERPGLSIM